MHRAAAGTRRRRRREGRPRPQRLARGRSNPSRPRASRSRGRGSATPDHRPRRSQRGDDCPGRGSGAGPVHAAHALRRCRSSCDSVGYTGAPGSAVGTRRRWTGSRPPWARSPPGHIGLERQWAQRPGEPGLQLRYDIGVTELQCEARVRQGVQAREPFGRARRAPRCRARGSPQGSRGRRPGSTPCRRRHRAGR